MSSMTEEQVVEMLRGLRQAEGQAKLAKRLGVSAAYISRILDGQRGPGPKMLIKLGLRVDYQPTNGN